MKRKLLFAATLLAGVLSGSSVFAQKGETIVIDGVSYTVESDNLITNGSFDGGVDGWKTVDYTTDAVASNFTLHTEGGFDNGAYITTNGEGVGSAKTIRQSVAVEAGKTYYFTVYTSGKAPKSNNFQYNALFKMTNATTENGVIKAFEWPQGAEKTATEWSQTKCIFIAEYPYVGVRMGWNEASNFDGFALYEIALDMSGAQTEWQKAHDALAAIATDVPNAVKNVISPELAKACPTTSVEDITAATAALQALIDSYEGVNVSYSKVKALLEKAKAEKENSIGVKTSLEAAISKAEADIETRTSAEDLDSDYTALETVRQAYVTSGAQPTEGNSFDWTFKLTNPSFEEGAKVGWKDNRNTTGTYNFQLNYDNPVDGKAVLDAWASQINYIEAYQNVTLPIGNYTLSGYLYSTNPSAQHLYAYLNATDYSSDNLTENGNWQQLSTDFAVDGETSVKVGIYSKGKNVSGNTDGWFRADHIQLFYNGVDAKVEISDAGYATYVAPIAVEFGDDVTAYIVSETKNGYAMLKSVDAVPAGTPVIVKAKKGTYSLNAVAKADEVDNLLEVAKEEIKAEDADGIYVLANIKGEGNGVGFYALGEGLALPAGKVYLKVDDTNVKFIGFNFGGDATAIKGVETATEAENAVIYNLAGQRVANPTKGIYIVNGKKVLVK